MDGQHRNPGGPGRAGGEGALPQTKPWPRCGCSALTAPQWRAGGETNNPKSARNNPPPHSSAATQQVPPSRPGPAAPHLSQPCGAAFSQTKPGRPRARGAPRAQLREDGEERGEVERAPAGPSAAMPRLEVIPDPRQSGGAPRTSPTSLPPGAEALSALLHPGKGWGSGRHFPSEPQVSSSAGKW